MRYLSKLLRAVNKDLKIVRLYVSASSTAHVAVSSLCEGWRDQLRREAHHAETLKQRFGSPSRLARWEPSGRSPPPE